MKQYCFTILLLLMVLTSARAQTYEINVHPGQELLTIVQILGEQYPSPNRSDYQAGVEAHFRSFEDHPAVEWIRNFRGKVYTDLPEIGWCYTNFKDFNFYFPEENLWYDLYGKDTIRQLLTLAADFAQQSDFSSFYENHQNAYQAWGAKVRAVIEEEGYVEKLDQFYANGNASDAKPHFYIALDPLNSWGAHAITHPDQFNPALGKVKAYSLGYWNGESTTKDSPSFNSTSFLANLVWHEGSHIYLSEILEKHKDKIESISHLYDGDDPKLRRQNIDDWSYCFEENLVRGIVIALTKQYRSNREYREQNAKEILSGFLYAEAIADWLEPHYIHDNESRSLEELLPHLIVFLNYEFGAK